MSERRNIGQILQDLGKVTQEDIDQAVEYQRREGGYFGQALVALGIVKQEEIEWGLASQFNLPYIFPDAGSVDPEAAFLVSADWALTHTALPVARVEGVVTLAVASPLQTEVAEDLAGRTGLDVDLALASPSAIRRVIRELFARESDQVDGLASPDAMSLAELRALARKRHAPRWGISVREGRSLGWYEEAHEVHRFRLRADWETDLERTLTPSPAERLPVRGEGAWVAQFRRGEGPDMVEVRGISTTAGYELLFTPREPEQGEPEPPIPPDELLEELRLLTRGDGLVLMMQTKPEELGPSLLPRLPGLVLPEGYRLLHLTEGAPPSTGEMVLTLPLDGPQPAMERRLRELREFRFDAVALEMEPEAGGVWDASREVAPVVFLLQPWNVSAPAEKVAPPGVDWSLRIERSDDGEWEWELRTIER